MGVPPWCLPAAFAGWVGTPRGTPSFFFRKFLSYRWGDPVLGSSPADGFADRRRQLPPVTSVDEALRWQNLIDASHHASPYGVYDVGDNVGWVNVGITADTSEFAVESLRRWSNFLGKARYPNANELLFTADCGGSNGNRVRLWKLELQKLVNEIGLSVTVCHLPPSTSKWNKIEHRLFSFITMNWRGGFIAI